MCTDAGSRAEARGARRSASCSILIAAIAAGCANPSAIRAPGSSEKQAPASVVATGPARAVAPPETPPPPAPPPPAAPPKRLALVPLGEVPAADVALASASISGTFGWIVDVLPAQDPPSSAWYAKRGRYRAEKILDWLRPELPDGADRIMAITAFDISTTKPPRADWGICGLADIGAAASVVSTFRIRKKMDGASGAQREARYRQRLRDLAAHEFGHQLGLEHCPTRGCVMEDAKGTVSTFDHSSGALCPACRAALAEAGFSLP
jgi:archaemetzincin